MPILRTIASLILFTVLALTPLSAFATGAYWNDSADCCCWGDSFYRTPEVTFINDTTENQFIRISYFRLFRNQHFVRMLAPKGTYTFNAFLAKNKNVQLERSLIKKIQSGQTIYLSKLKDAEKEAQQC